MMMKKGVVLVMCSTLMLSGCGTNTGTGTYLGAQLGSILGSAIGGLAGGPRGSDLGTVVGMVGGAAVGAAVGNAVDKAERQEVHDHYERVQAQRQRPCGAEAAHGGCSLDGEGHTGQPVAQLSADSLGRYSDDWSGFDASNSGDDRLYDFQGSDYSGNYSAAQPETVMPLESSVVSDVSAYTFTPNIEIRNARFVDDNEDGVLSRGETGKIIFEVMNRGEGTLYDVVPSVVLAERNRHIAISPSIHVESIAPGYGVRYTAMVKADRRLRDGCARFALTVLQGNKSIGKVTEFDIMTKK